MLIEFFCTNITEFDAATGRSSTCGHRLVVPEDKIGQQVSCPNCNEEVLVPYESVINEKPRKRAAKKRPAKRPAAAAATKKSAGLKKKRSDSGLGDEFGLEAPMQRPRSDVMDQAFETADVNSRQLAGGNEKRCPKCGNLLMSGKCTDCRYVEPQFESATQRLEDIEVRPAGFQRWFCDIMTEGVSVGVLGIGMHLMAGFMTLIMIVFSVLILEMPWSLIVALMTVMCAMLYLGMVYKGYQFMRVPGAKLAWFQKPFWNSALVFARMLNWQGYDSRFKGRGIIDKRGVPVSDSEIPAIDNLGRCQVLDLEGTLVTDRGLRPLYGLQNLHCLVLRKTGVTDEGVFRLQQANPKLWIWY